MVNKEKIREIVEEYRDYVTALRREFHRNPELSNKEFHTREILIREIEDMGVPYTPVEGTGLIAVIEGGKPGKSRVIRSDIDALPVKEEKENLKREKECVSCVDGVSHACGHDAHMAMLLGTMRVLLKLKDELAGTVYCCFEQGEETTTGVYAMLDALEKYPIEECFSLHVYSGLEAGKVNVVPGPRMAGTVSIGFTVKGKTGHGSRPDQAANPIVPAAHIITQIDSAFRNQIDAEKTVTLSLCMFQAGEAVNVIPESAYLAGSARFFDDEEGKKALEIINRVAENTAACHKCSIEFAPRNKVELWPVVNNADVANRVAAAVGELGGADVLSPCERWYASESYGKYLAKYPGALGFLGIKNEEYGSGAAHHNGKFDIDESALALGVLTEVGFALSN